ncbi:hypothetical protein DFH06DRAFT_1352013 [Mycena polygramma]|nr:hypothetical protein DFH06DRAFT_1352013 [Mycena polygramma]
MSVEPKTITHTCRNERREIDSQVARDGEGVEASWSWLRQEQQERQQERGRLAASECARCKAAIATILDEGARAIYCASCGGDMMCEECSRLAHASNPLHFVQAWCDDMPFWRQMRLRDLGLVFQLGHGGEECPAPQEGQRLVVIMDISGVQTVVYRYCGCGQFEATEAGNSQQLQGNGWYRTTLTAVEPSVDEDEEYDEDMPELLPPDGYFPPLPQIYTLTPTSPWASARRRRQEMQRLTAIDHISCESHHGTAGILRGQVPWVSALQRRRERERLAASVCVACNGDFASILDRGARAIYCPSCGGHTMCEECSKLAHATTPLHFIRGWCDDMPFWKQMCLREIGFVFQLGHRGEECPAPQEGQRSTLIMDVTGFQTVSYLYCGCGQFEATEAGNRRQLEGNRWYPPATSGSGDPRSCITFKMGDAMLSGAVPVYPTSS